MGEGRPAFLLHALAGALGLRGPIMRLRGRKPGDAALGARTGRAAGASGWSGLPPGSPRLAGCTRLHANAGDRSSARSDGEGQAGGFRRLRPDHVDRSRLDGPPPGSVIEVSLRAAAPEGRPWPSCRSRRNAMRTPRPSRAGSIATRSARGPQGVRPRSSADTLVSAGQAGAPCSPTTTGSAPGASTIIATIIFLIAVLPPSAWRVPESRSSSEKSPD